MVTLDSPPHRAGFVALLGRPNAGKSTLVNRLVGQKLAIVSPKPQTTRTRVLGIVSGPTYQMAIVDTPGLHEPNRPLGRALVKVAKAAARSADVVGLLTEATLQPGGVEREGRELLDLAHAGGCPVALLVNKTDLVARLTLLPLIERWSHLRDFALVWPFSALTGENLEGLPAALSQLLPVGPPLFPEDVTTDQTERALCAELVREQVYRQTRQEIPYSVAVEIEEFDETKRSERPAKVRISALLFVERESQKGILIGKNAAQLKAIGTAARHEIEALLGARVFLSLTVRVEERWSESPRALRRFGYGPSDDGASGG
jgi:GTP-binding protein Era